MLEFRDIDISDKERINTALKFSGFMGCEYSFANNMAWKRLAESKITFFQDYYITCAFAADDNIPAVSFPAGYGDFRELVSELKAFSNNLGAPLRFCSVTDSQLEMFNELYRGQFECELDRDGSDYIYNASDLINLSGKKYHSKRNHLARFKELDYEFSQIAENDIYGCIAFLTETYNNKSSEQDHSYIAEQYAINTFFTYFNELDLKGGLIKINGKTAAVTLGEEIGGDTFCVHIEKADTSHNGIYTGINNLFAAEFASDCRYINREEDLGLEGLRKSKLSYKPAFLLNKYIITFK